MRINHDDLMVLTAAINALDRIDGVDARLHQDILMASANLGRIVRAAEAVNVAVPQAPSSKPRIDGTAADQSKSRFAGMSLSEAAVEHLAAVGRSQRTKEIVAALMDAGFETTAESPASALVRALDRRAKNYPDLVKVSFGVWCLRQHLTDKEKAAVAHKERTARGMKQAKLRGVRVGIPPKLTEETALKIKQLRASGESACVAAEATGVSHSTVYNWEKVIEEWNPGEPWPPKGAIPKE